MTILDIVTNALELLETYLKKLRCIMIKRKRLIKAVLFILIAPLTVPFLLPVLYVIKIKDLLKGE